MAEKVKFIFGRPLDKSTDADDHDDDDGNIMCALTISLTVCLSD